MNCSHVYLGPIIISNGGDSFKSNSMKKAFTSRPLKTSSSSSVGQFKEKTSKSICDVIKIILMKRIKTKKLSRTRTVKIFRKKNFLKEIWKTKVNETRNQTTEIVQWKILWDSFPQSKLCYEFLSLFCIFQCCHFSGFSYWSLMQQLWEQQQRQQQMIILLLPPFVTNCIIILRKIYYGN